MTRLYQSECLEESVAERQRGIWAQLVVLPTASGKMVVASHVPEVHGLKPREKALFTVHRDELVNQAAAKFAKYNPHLKVGVHTGRSEAAADCDVLVASIQTIGRMCEGKHTKRLTKFDPDWIRIVIVDECHRIVSKSFLNVLKYCRALKGEGDVDTSKLLLGFTATPQRTDGMGLDRVFQKIVFERDIRRMIKEGWLASIKGYSVQTDADISEVKSRKDDFVPGQLAKVINCPERNDLVVRKYMELGEGFPAIGFGADVQHAYDLAERFHAHGITAFAISGETPLEDRKMAYEAFRDGRCRVLLGYDVLTEGFDMPMAVVGLGCRPMKSSLIFRQSLGRVLRPYPAPEDAPSHAGWKKPYAIWIDFADACGRHHLNTVPTLFGLNHKFDMAGQDVISVVEEVELLQAQQPSLDLKQMKDIIQVRSTVSNIDLLRAPEVPPHVRQHSRFEWLETGAGTLRLALPTRGILEIRVNALGYRDVYKTLNGARVLHCTMRNTADALKEADKLVSYRDSMVLGTDRKWKQKAPKPEQCKYLWTIDRDLRIEFPSDKGGPTGPEKFYAFAAQQYTAGQMDFSRGAISARINLKTTARS